MQSLRDYAEGSLVRKEWMRGARWERCSGEVKGESELRAVRGHALGLPREACTDKRLASSPTQLYTL